MLMAWLRLEEEMSEEPCEEGEEQICQNTGQQSIMACDCEIDSTNRLHSAEHRHGEVNQFLHRLPFFSFDSSYHSHGRSVLFFLLPGALRLLERMLLIVYLLFI